MGGKNSKGDPPPQGAEAESVPGPSGTVGLNPKDEDSTPKNPPDSIDDVTPKRPPGPQDQDSSLPSEEHLLESAGAVSESPPDSMDDAKVEPECLLESAGAVSGSPPDSTDDAKVEPERLLESTGAVSDVKESEPASLPKAKRGSKSKRFSPASVSGHPRGTQSRPNNKKKKKKRRGKDSFHEQFVGPCHSQVE